MVQIGRKPERNSAQVALPLIYEDTIVGVLFVKVHRNFERCRPESARSLQRAACAKFPAQGTAPERACRTNTGGAFSRRIRRKTAFDIINLIQSVMKEQSFGALASSYLKEAHAIAYLDGTLSYLNRQMRHLVKSEIRRRFTSSTFSACSNNSKPMFSTSRVSPSAAFCKRAKTYKAELYFPETDKTLETANFARQSSFERAIHPRHERADDARLFSDYLPRHFRRQGKRKTPQRYGFPDVARAANADNEHQRICPTAFDGRNDVGRIKANFWKLSRTNRRAFQKCFRHFFRFPISNNPTNRKFPKRRSSSIRSSAKSSKIYKETAKRKRIRLVEQANSHLPPVAADKGLITRAVSNLIDNAIKYSPERTSRDYLDNSRIGISARRRRRPRLRHSERRTGKNLAEILSRRPRRSGQGRRIDRTRDYLWSRKSSNSTAARCRSNRKSVKARDSASRFRDYKNRHEFRDRISSFWFRHWKFISENFIAR